MRGLRLRHHNDHNVDGQRLAVSDGAKRRGQSLVELALALPLMLLIMLGTIDLGRMYFDYIQMRNAAMEGALYGSRNPTDTAGAITRAQGHGVPAGTSVAALCTGSGCTTVGQQGEFVVTATRTFTPVSTAFLSTYFGLGAVNLQATATARVMS